MCIEQRTEMLSKMFLNIRVDDRVGNTLKRLIGVSGNQQKGNNEQSTVQFPWKTQNDHIENKTTKLELQWNWKNKQTSSIQKEITQN